MNGIGSHCLLNRADETFAQAMTYLYLKSQSDDNIREEVIPMPIFFASFLFLSSIVTRSDSEYSKYIL